MKTKCSVDFSFNSNEYSAANTIFDMLCEMGDIEWDALVEKTGIPDDFYFTFERLVDFIRANTD